MRRAAISSLTPEQAADELAMMEMKRLLQKARKAQTDALAQTALQALEDLCIETDLPFGADHVVTLKDAVLSYVQRGEYGLRTIMKEIRNQYLKEDTP